MPESENENLELGRRIRAHRRSLGDLSQKGYGDRYHVNQITVSNWETGKFRPHPSHMKLLMADGLNLGDVDEIFFEEPRTLNLPFEQTFLLELRIGPQRASSVAVRFNLRRLAN